MHLQACRTFGVLVAFCIWDSNARSLHDAKRFAQSGGDLIESSGYMIPGIKSSNTSQLAIRADDDSMPDESMPDDSPPGIQCRSLCGAATGTTKRGWTELETRSLLVKRAFDPWPPLEGTEKAKNDWMKSACNELTPDQEIVPTWAQKSPGYASAVTAPLGDKAFRYGMQQICGCTMLFVVSRKRVYLAHYWETASFAKKPGDTYRLEFAKQVTNFLKRGFTVPVGEGRTVAQDSLAQHSADFKGDPHLVAWILSPRAEPDEPNPGGFIYERKVKQMADTIAPILGINADQVKLHVYDAVDIEKDTTNKLRDTAAGRMIFDYDPEAGDKKEPVAWRIIWQNGILDLQQWPAPAQQAAAGS